MDKSPLKTLTLEDFLESERHKLTGTLTPVTPETFAKWKTERMDKKAAEDQARIAKEATGRALFEKGDWEASGGEEAEDESDDEEEDDMETLRRETEAIRERKEADRIAALGGTKNTFVPAPVPDDVDGSEDADDEGEEVKENGEEAKENGEAS